MNKNGTIWRMGHKWLCNAYGDSCDVQLNKETAYKSLCKARSDDALDPWEGNETLLHHSWGFTAYHTQWAVLWKAWLKLLGPPFTSHVFFNSWTMTIAIPLADSFASYTIFTPRLVLLMRRFLNTIPILVQLTALCCDSLLSKSRDKAAKLHSLSQHTPPALQCHQKPVLPQELPSKWHCYLPLELLSISKIPYTLSSK